MNYPIEVLILPRNPPRCGVYPSFTSSSKMKAVNALIDKGYKAQPLKRVYIKKEGNTNSPLGIPTMYDQVMQALYC